MKKINDILNKKILKLERIDYVIIFALVLIYSCISFYKIGSFVNPQTFYYFKTNENIIFEFDEPIDILKMRFFSGERKGIFNIYLSSDGEKFVYNGSTKEINSFKWSDKFIKDKAKFVKLESNKDTSIGEIAFYDNNKKIVNIKRMFLKNKSFKTNNLVDESKVIPERISYYNSTYFDEIYFARTAYDYANGLNAYEWTHPPLGKEIQAIPILLTKKFTPFLYRLMGNVAGILMIPVMYVFAKELFKKRKYSILASFLMMFDCFHFTQTRMGTVDSYLVLFIILSFYFMFKYISTGVENKYLFGSGIFFALATSVKWTGMYAGLGLAIIFFINMIKNKKYNVKIFLKGFLFFVFIPLTLYCSFYFLFGNQHLTNNIGDIVNMQKGMYKYHSQLSSTHSFSSPWYSWPIMYKPIWYHTYRVDRDVKETIVGIGNIAIWWFGIVAAIYLIYKIIKEKKDKDIFILIAILSLWLPYLFIGRVMFIYHFFPVLPFIIFAIVCLIEDINNKLKNDYFMYAYMGLVLIAFIIYFPVISGIPTSIKYIDKLKLFPSWYF